MKEGSQGLQSDKAFYLINFRSKQIQADESMSFRVK